VKAEQEENAPVNTQATKAPAKHGRNDPVLRELISWFWVILAFVLIEGGVIPSGSMENTVLIGDHLIVSRLGYDAGIPFTSYHMPLWRNPKRGEIIVFRAPLADQGYPDLIKRCIGVPGDRIKIVQGKVFVNGDAIGDSHAIHRPGYANLPWENFPSRSSEILFSEVPSWGDELSKNVVNGELVVPPGQYFMMGDNRDNSNDSRFWGFVPRENIIGKPLIIYWSYDAPTTDLNNSSVSLAHVVDLVEHFFSKTRWRRTFMLIHGYPVK
jgi:signal peptidase I